MSLIINDSCLKQPIMQQTKASAVKSKFRQFSMALLTGGLQLIELQVIWPECFSVAFANISTSVSIAMVQTLWIYHA